MGASSGGFHGLYYIAESTFGTTPSTPEMTQLRHTSCSLVLSKDTFQSNELRSDRQIQDVRTGAQKVGGDIGFEFSWKEFDPLLEGALFGAWTSNVLKAGTVQKSFTLERKFADITQYGVFTGCTMDKFSLEVKPNAIVTGSFSVVGKGAAYSGTPLDAIPTASQQESPYDSFTGVMKEGGSTVAFVTGLSLSIQNNLSPNYVVGSNQTPFITAGRTNVSGTLSCMFQDLTMLNKFINETETSIEFTLGNGTTKSYTFKIPRVRYTGGDNAVSGEGVVTLSMPFMGVYDGTVGSALQITRTAS